MKIDGLQKLTLLDFPETMSCIIFTKGCNLKCPFCQNSSLVVNKDEPLINEDEVFKFLNKRKNILDGVVISGGEPTLQKDLKEFIKKIKELNYKVKLDTNGTNPNILKNLIDEGLIDYVAMDIKNIKEKYNLTTGSKKLLMNNIIESINILKNSNIDYEFRTTIVKEFHTIDDIKKIISLIDGSKYYIQNFQNNENVIDKNLTSFTKEELLLLDKELRKDFTNFKIREL